MARVTKVVLQHFRNQPQVVWQFDHPVSVIVGDNGQGKTSVLEALYLLATGESFRAGRVDEMIFFDQELGRVTAKLDTDDRLEVVLTRGLVQGKRTQSRLFSVNQARRRRKDFVGHFTAVVFRPEDMRLMEGSPSRRREFMNAVLSQVSPAYAQSLTTYEQALVRRNKLLPAVREHETPATVLTYWTLQLIKHGEKLQTMRQAFLETFAAVVFPTQFQVRYLPSVISEARSEEYRAREIAAGHSLIGPHKDDFEVDFQWHSRSSVADDWHNVGVYGSRGQQRMAVLWLKLAALEYLRTQTANEPTLLLDDIFSELDSDVRELVMQLVTRQPTVITTTEQAVADELHKNIPSVQILSFE